MDKFVAVVTAVLGIVTAAEKNTAHAKIFGVCFCVSMIALVIIHIF